MYSSRTPFGMSIQRASDDSCLRHSPTILRPKVSKRDSPSPGSLGEGSLTGRSGTMLYHLFGSSSIGSPIWASFKSVSLRSLDGMRKNPEADNHGQHRPP